MVRRCNFFSFFFCGELLVLWRVIHKFMSHTTHPPQSWKSTDPPWSTWQKTGSESCSPAAERREAAVPKKAGMGKGMVWSWAFGENGPRYDGHFILIDYSKSTLKTLNCDLFDLCIIFLETSLEVGINIHSVIRLTVSFWSIESKSPWNSTFEMVELPRDHPHVVCWGWRQLGDLGTTVWTQQSNPAK